jgi:long-chain fatty acid transport protein
MKRMMMTSILALGLGSGSAFAGGFQVPEMGIKAMGMGNAYTAVADDPSALWFNPAGISFQHGTAATLGATMVFPKIDFTTTGGTPYAMSRDAVTIPHAYLMHRGEGSRFAYGIGVNSPFGLNVKWPTTAPFASSAQYGQLKAITVNPNLAYRVTDHLAVAVGVDYVDMYRVDFNGTALPQTFHGDGWGANVAAMYHSDHFNAGISYRSSVKINAKGTSTLVAASATSANTINVTEPDMLNIGVAMHPDADWTVSADADWVNWKRFDRLAFAYSPPLPVYGSAITVPENWKATWAYRLGAEWRYSPSMRLRFGYSYDPTPINSPDFTPLLPGNDRQGLHLGYGLDLSRHATLDLAYMYMWLKTRNQTQSTGTNASRNGTYKATLQLAGASLTYHF